MKDKKACLQCNSIGVPIMKKKGSAGITILLVLCWIIPGLIYSIWRHSTRYLACESCGSSNLVPLNSPAGVKILNSQSEA